MKSMFFVLCSSNEVRPGGSKSVFYGIIPAFSRFRVINMGRFCRCSRGTLESFHGELVLAVGRPG